LPEVAKFRYPVTPTMRLRIVGFLGWPVRGAISLGALLQPL
jgi:hypothetical protein